jgi:transcription initiation factor TFIIIB Brf1 subunit/transcription initiation factor TFIIB
VMNHYKKFLDMGNKGISPVFMSAAILYYTCQKSNHNISLQKISEMLKRYSLDLSSRYFIGDISRRAMSDASTNKDECQKKLYKTYTTFINIMGLEQPAVVTYETMISEMSERLRTGDKLKLREIHIRLAKALGKKITDSSKVVFLGKSPKAVAVVLIYYTLIRNSVSNVDIVNVSRETGISTVTIRKLFNDILVTMEKKGISYERDIVSTL